MAAQPTHDTVTLKNITGRSDSILLLNSSKTPKKPAIEHVQPPGILGRLRSFIPQIAAANEALSNADSEKLDADVNKVDLDLDESDTSTDDAASSDEIESDVDEDPKVEFNISLFRAQQSDEENDMDLKLDVEQLPEGFRERDNSLSCDGPPSDKKPKILVEEL
ncbi:hypothetical protein RB195_003134 [Necator americanus]|uniref:Uncharacterized protein n=2 Tax=Necator americanus TaxID=51031 RepID=A0ABR1DMT4_NECAM|nr:hypothetical protein NECAME_05341 [Necator americanus]ETN69234.1 hypothetical protein NECAME_05341 [Necator americanus]